jgi:hypothetical protein
MKIIFLRFKTNCFQFNFSFLWSFKKSNTPRFVMTGSLRAMKTLSHS